MGSITEAKIWFKRAMPSAGGCCTALAVISYLAELSVVRVLELAVVTLPLIDALNPQNEPPAEEPADAVVDEVSTLEFLTSMVNDTVASCMVNAGIGTSDNIGAFTVIACWDIWPLPEVTGRFRVNETIFTPLV